MPTMPYPGLGIAIASNGRTMTSESRLLASEQRLFRVLLGDGHDRLFEIRFGPTGGLTSLRSFAPHTLRSHFQRIRNSYIDADLYRRYTM